MSTNETASPENTNQTVTETQPVVADAPTADPAGSGPGEGTASAAPAGASTVESDASGPSSNEEVVPPSGAPHSTPSPTATASPSPVPPAAALPPSQSPPPGPGSAQLTEEEAEFRRRLASAFFSTDVFTVAAGQIPRWRQEAIEAEIAATLEKFPDPPQPTAGQPPQTQAAYRQSVRNKIETRCTPKVASVQVLERLAEQLKVFVDGVAVIDADMQTQFKRHFVTTPLGQLCDATWVAARPRDVSFGELKNLGIHRDAIPFGIRLATTLARRVTARVAAEEIPNGDLSNNFISTLTLLRRDKYLTAGGKIEWNVMSGDIELNRRAADEAVLLGSVMEELGTNYVVRTERSTKQLEPAKGTLEHALAYEAMLHSYHPTREWFESLRGKWDGNNHLAKVIKLIKAVKVVPPNADFEEIERITRHNKLAILQLRYFFVGLVARTYKPGEKVDTMLVLKGAQGVKKSTFFRVIAPAGRFSSSPLIMGNKDSMLMMQRFSLVELPEMNNMSKQEVGEVKAFVTQSTDDFRVPYDKRVKSFPRHCVLCSTTNDDAFLRDPTGSRRFEVVEVFGVCDVRAVAAELEQFWAQAVHLYFEAETCPDCIASRDNETRCEAHRWWLTGSQVDDRAEVNEQFTKPEPYIEWLQDWISNSVSDKNATKQGLHPAHKNTDALRVYELLEAVGLPPKECHDTTQQMRMANALRACGYAKKKTEKGSLWLSPGMQDREQLKLVHPRPAKSSKKPRSGTGTLKNG